MRYFLARARQKRAVRPRADDHSLQGVGATSIVKRIFRRNRTEEPAIAGGRLQGVRDDEGMPLIGPPCQLFFEAFMPRQAACYFAWGYFRYFRERSCRRF